MPEGEVVALDLISSLCSAVCKRLKHQSFAQSTAPGRASSLTGNTEGDREHSQKKMKATEKKTRGGQQEFFKALTS